MQRQPDVKSSAAGAKHSWRATQEAAVGRPALQRQPARVKSRERPAPLSALEQLTLWSKRAASGAGLALLLALGTPQPSAAAAVLPHSDAKRIYMGSGCFWGRQKDFIDLEGTLGRKPEDRSAVVGYAGGVQGQSADGKVCYYHAPRDSVYERLGHAEVTQVELTPEREMDDMSRFAELYFSQFQQTPFGQLRLDPMDTGPGYRNIIGIPGGVRSPYFAVLQAKNKFGMQLVEGRGNDNERGKPTEGDKFNTVWIVDSDKLPFYQAEEYHQFHDGIGHPFPASYKVDQKRAAKLSGRITPTGCPEYSFFG